jgi:hypothetical protein
MVNNSQRSFWALRLADRRQPAEGSRSGELELAPLHVAKEHGVLNWVGSTYSAENKAVYDGLSRAGVPIVSMAPILKHDMFPLAEILQELLRVGSIGTSSPVEIEFAVNLETPAGRPAEFAFLQLRPFSSSREKETVEMGELAPGELICESTSALGHGHLDEIHDIVVVDKNRFVRSRSRECAAAVSQFNRGLVAEGRPYLLIGVGRWGSTEPWLGIPVRWSDISGARVIVEAGFKDMRVTPSQGTHFFQNLTSLNIGYLTVNEERGEGFVDWSFLAEQPAMQEIDPVRHLRFEAPLVVTMNGSTQHAIVRKPVVG